MTRRLSMPLMCISALALIAADGPPPHKPAIARESSAAVRTVAVKSAPHVKPVRRLARKPARPRPSSPVAGIAMANRAATVVPAAHAYINAAQVYPFSEGAIYQVYAAPERVTDIALQPGEILGAVASGDTVRWVIGDTSSGAGAGKRTHILIKPFAPGLRTNLVVTTDRRTYHLSLISTAGAATASLSWTYPHDALIALKRAAAEAEAAKPVAAGLDIASLRFNYAISGDRPSWRPLRAFDDGRQIFIEFAREVTTVEAPPLFIVDGKGQAQLVNYRMNGRHYIVDRIFDAAELRLGLKDQQVVRITRLDAGAVTLNRKAR